MKNFSRLPRSASRPFRHVAVLAALAGGLGLACSNEKGGTDTDGTDSGNGASGNGASGNGASGNGASGNGASGNGASGNGASSGVGGSGNGASGSGASGNGGSASQDPNDACGLSKSSSSSGNGTGSSSVPEFEDCTGVSYEGETVPADILILLDRSTSMGDHNVVEGDDSTPTRWEAITEALKEFISAESTGDLRVGIQYFPLYEGVDAVCDAAGYADPAVPIDFVTGDHKQALLDSIEAQFPGGLTPAVPALAGALQYAKEWADSNPDRPTMVVWAADGYPTDPTEEEDGCDDTSISSLEALTEEYSTGNPRVGTFVVGLGEVANLKRVAEKGGTEKAFFVSECPTAVDDLLESLKRVSSSPALCEFRVPEPEDGSLVDPNQVNVTFTPEGGDPEVVYRVDSAAKCGSGGWYYGATVTGEGGASGQPEEHLIRVCPESCSRFGGGTVDVVMGCQTFELN